MKFMLMAALAFVITGSMAYAESTRESSSSAPARATMEAKPATATMSVKRAETKPTVTAVFGKPSTSTVGGMTLKAAPDDGGTKYECTGNTCTCHGSFDCVKMIASDEVCDNDTVGCNDDICVCSTP